VRTTITLDDDVAALLARLRRERRMGLKSAVNSGLRAGLRQLYDVETPAAPYATPVASVGRVLIDVDDVADAIALAEGDAHR
jgi:hypothetical protein